MSRPWASYLWFVFKPARSVVSSGLTIAGVGLFAVVPIITGHLPWGVAGLFLGLALLFGFAGFRLWREKFPSIALTLIPEPISDLKQTDDGGNASYGNKWRLAIQNRERRSLDRVQVFLQASDPTDARTPAPYPLTAEITVPASDTPLVHIDLVTEDFAPGDAPTGWRVDYDGNPPAWNTDRIDGSRTLTVAVHGQTFPAQTFQFRVSLNANGFVQVESVSEAG